MNRQRELSGWLTLLIRTIAAGGLVFETLVDKLRNPTALVVFGGLAGLPDVLGYRAAVKREIEREVERDEERKQ
jgi:hypothetical protein